MNSLPHAGSVPQGENKEKIVSQVHRKFSGSLANDSKWNELINFVRNLEGWRPSYRSKWVNGFISEWDIEWFYHLPFPFVGVEWFDIALNEYVRTGILTQTKIIDHSKPILDKLMQIGFEFEAKGDVVRIWGYHPKSYEDFPPEASA